MKQLLVFIAATLLTPTIMAQKIDITIDGVTRSITLSDNVATQALLAKLQEAPITVSLNTNGDFEIWGPLGFSLPTANEYINGQPGDVVLYSGSNICIFYGTNSYSYTRLGKIEGMSASQLKTFLKGGQSNIAVTLSVPTSTGISAPKASTGNDTYYTLSGQRTDRPRRGIYIVNGKKRVLSGFCND